MLELGCEIEGPKSDSPQVMAVFERGAGVKHNVHLNNQLVARVVGLQPLNLLDGFGKPHGQVEH